MIQRTPPAGVIERWQPELDRIAPPTERGHAHLLLVWEPGEEWAPVERWVIYEMLRPEQAYLGIWEDLDGPPPRRFGRWDPVLERFRRTRTLHISQRQWEIHRETGLYGKPIWVVQGTKGGHKRNWSPLEQNLIMLNAGVTEPLDPPAPGDLPYAEPDQRTITQLQGLDLVARWGSLLHLVATHDHVRDSLDRRNREVARAMAEQVWGWLQAQVEESMQLSRRLVAEIDDHAADVPVPDYELDEEQFITEVASAAPY